VTNKRARRKAELHEKFYLLEKDVEKIEKFLRIRHHDAVRIVEPTEKKEKEEAADNEFAR